MTDKGNPTTSEEIESNMASEPLPSEGLPPFAHSDVEVLADWLHFAARDAGQLESLRLLVHRAAAKASEHYADNDFLNVQDLIARFASAFDESVRNYPKDEG